MKNKFIHVSVFAASFALCAATPALANATTFVSFNLDLGIFQAFSFTGNQTKTNSLTEARLALTSVAGNLGTVDAQLVRINGTTSPLVAGLTSRTQSWGLPNDFSSGNQIKLGLRGSDWADGPVVKGGWKSD